MFLELTPRQFFFFYVFHILYIFPSYVNFAIQVEGSHICFHILKVVMNHWEIVGLCYILST